MDIFNENERQVVCIRNDKCSIHSDNNEHLLIIGEIYTVIDVEVHSWHTMVTLKEFPNEQFNSVLFVELYEV